MSDTGSGRGMKTLSEGLWIARMPTDHAWRAITGADEMKSNEMNKMSMEKFVAGETRRNSEKIYHETHTNSVQQRAAAVGIKRLAA